MEELKPVLCVVAGPNGAGKTSTTIQLLHNEWTDDCVYINPDDIAQNMFGDWNSEESVRKAAQTATKYRDSFQYSWVGAYGDECRRYMKKRHWLDNDVDARFAQTVAKYFEPGSEEYKYILLYADIHISND